MPYILSAPWVLIVVCIPANGALTKLHTSVEGTCFFYIRNQYITNMRLKSCKIKKHLRNTSRLNFKRKLKKLFLLSQLPMNQHGLSARRMRRRGGCFLTPRSRGCAFFVRGRSPNKYFKQALNVRRGGGEEGRRGGGEEGRRG